MWRKVFDIGLAIGGIIIGIIEIIGGVKDLAEAVNETPEENAEEETEESE